MMKTGIFTSYIFILICLFIIIGLILLVSLLSKSSNLPKIKTKKERVPFLSPSIYVFLVKHGIIGSGPLTKAFVKALSFLDSHIANKDYKYAIPWYLIVGPTASGKSSILSSLADLHLPDYEVDRSRFDGCEWFMFMNGIILEIKERLFALGNTKSLINRDWQLLSMLLKYFRPRKPLDGIIITVPVDMLKREDRFPAEKKVTAQNMFDNLFWLQSTLNLKLPVYLILTKCDVLEGFANLCIDMSSQEKEQIFGWSSSYSSETAYSNSWVDEAFDYMAVGLKKMVLKIAANAAVPETIEDSLYVAEDLFRIKEEVKVFTNSIFSPSRTGVELVLRGIYLTGSDFEGGEKKGGKTVSALNPEYIPSFSNKSTLVNFVKDLFCEKIFLERNIAQPIMDNFVFHGRRVITKRVIMCLTSLFLVLGFYFSNKHITNKTAEFAFTLSEIDSTLYQLKNSGGRADLKDKTKKLLDYIFKLDPTQLYSLFIPMSWFSPIRTKIQNTASNAFDSAVVSSMYSELEKKVMDMTGQMKVRLSRRIVLSPTSLEEFKALKQYVQRVVDLEKTGESYNKILLEDDENAIENLARFLYADNVTNKSILKQRLKTDRAKFKEFNLSKHKDEIIKNIITLQKAFVEHCFSNVMDRIFVSLAASLENFLRDVEDPDKQVFLKDVVDLYKKMDTVITFLKSNILNWWDDEHFNPGPEYQDLLDLMKKSSLINDKFIASFQEYADAVFTDFKFRMSNIRSSLTGNFIGRGRYIIVSEPSHSFMNFYKNLQALLQEKFLIDIDNHDIVTEISGDKWLLWNKGMMSQSSKLIKLYQDFKSTTLKGFDANMYPFYRELSKKLLYNSVKSLIAKAQILEDGSQILSESMQESTLKKVSGDLKEVFSDLLTVAEFFNDEFPNNFGQSEDFIKMIYANYTKVINTVDVIFRGNEPFSIRSEMFDGWDGKANPSLFGFGASDQEELNSYLLAQIGRLNFLAKTLAEPVVNLLRTKYFNFAVNEILLSKWSDMIQAIEDYNKKIPGNSIGVLENFIKKVLGEFTVDSISSENKLDAFLDIKKDFFLNKRTLIARYLKYRAQELLYVNSLILYNKVAKCFNEQVAGFFPFVNGYSNLYPDCGAEQLKGFLEVFRTIGAPTKKALADLAGANLEAKKALIFIGKIEQIVPFLEAWIQNYYRKSAVESVIAFKVEFRAEKAHEVGGDQIIDWRLKVGDDFVTFEDGEKMMNWSIGQEIRAIYQWAADSNELPHADTKGLVDVMGQNAVFRYIGNWALIRLIKNHQAMAEAYPGSGVTLLFNIPTVHKENFKPFRDAKLFSRIKFFEKNKDAWTAVSIPDFPHVAPVIEMRMDSHATR